jgi:LPS-assembly lipoprotein
MSSILNHAAVNQPADNQWPRTLAFAFLAMLLMSLLHACGFQLRGAVNLSKDMSPVYIEKNSYFDLAREIKDVLSSNAIKTVDSAKSSKSQLILSRVDKSRRVLSVDGDGRVKEYLLTYRVTFEIKRKLVSDDKFESRRDTISLSRSLLFEPDAVLAVVNEAEAIYKDIEREVAGLILLKLQSFSGQMAKAGQVTEATEGDAGNSNKVSSSQADPAAVNDVPVAAEPENTDAEEIEAEGTKVEAEEAGNSKP